MNTLAVGGLLFFSCTAPVESGSEKARPDESGATETGETAEDSAGETSPVDLDGDGHSSEDCDDGDASVHPGADEVANDGIDQDCDGSDVTDADLDGVDATEDCDDSDPSVSPAADEAAGDQIDNDCDGYVDLDEGSLADVSAFVIGERVSVQESAGRSYLGETLGVTPDLDGDGGADLLVGAAEQVVYLLSGSAVAGDGETHRAMDLAWLDFSPTDGSSHLLSAAIGGDFDADGSSDLWFAEAPVEPDDPQRLILASSTVVGERTGSLLTAEWARVTADETSPWLDVPMWASEADLDGDGLQDLCTAAALNVELPRAGGLCCISGSAMVSGAALEACSDADGWITSSEVVLVDLVDAVADIDGDGRDEILTWGPGFFYLFGGDVLLGGGHAEGSAVATASIDTDGSLQPARSVVVLPNTDDDYATVLLLTGEEGDASSPGHSGVASVWIDLHLGGARQASEAAGSIYFNPGARSSQIDGMGSAQALSDESTSLAFSVWTDDTASAVVFLDVALVPTTGQLNLATVTDQLDTEGRTVTSSAMGSGPRPRLLFADLDGDGDDDIATANSLQYAEVEDAAGDEKWPAGAVTLVQNPR